MEEKKFLFDKIMNFIQAASIEYVFLREASVIQHVLSSEEFSEIDIDIYIKNDRVSELYEYLEYENFIRIMPGKLFIHVDSGLKVDVHHNVYLRLPFPGEDFFLKNTQQIKKYSHLSNTHQFLVNLLHPLDMSGFRGHRSYSEDKYFFLKSHRSLIKDTKVKDLICTWLGNSFYSKIEYLLYKDPRLIIEHYYYLKFISILQSKTLFKYIFKRAYKKFLDFRRKRGMLISVMGVDGSGKTTLSENLKIFFNSYLHNRASDIIYMGMLGPYILPINYLSRIYRIILRQEFTKEDPIDLEKIRNLSTLESIKQRLVFCLIGLDLMIRNLIVLWKIFFLKKILITDRSIFDQHTKFNSSLLLRFIRKISFKPSYFLFLEGDTNKIFNRKKEYSPPELYKHQNLHINFLKNEFQKELIIINAQNSADRVLVDSLLKITKKYNESY
tara:strand:+ start:617 stop:1939 length:1323 start_codon:yes stop_codon:yes gene_type:complete